MLAENVKLLTEAGGVISWVKRFYTGTDNAGLAKVRQEISGIGSKAEKEKLLKHVKKLINEAERRGDRGGVGGAASNFVRGAVVGGYVGGAVKAATHAARKESIGKYLEALKKVKSAIEAVNPED